MQKIVAIILKLPIISTIIEKLKKLVLPGFEGVPLFDVLVFFVRGLQNGDLTNRSAGLAFNFFLAIFPSIIFLFTLIPYIPIENFQEQLLGLMKGVMPKSAFEATESTIEDIIKNQRGSLLSIGFLSALFFSTNGFNSMIRAFNLTYHSVESRKPLMQRLISFLLVIIVFLLLVVAIGLTVYSELILNKLPFGDNLTSFLIKFGRVVILFALFLCTVSFIYYLAPAKKSGWKFISVGSTFTTLLSILASVGFAFYVNNFGQYNKLYGSIGTLIVVLLWIYFNSIILLLGFELNASIHGAKKQRNL